MNDKTKDKSRELSDNELGEVSGGAIKGSGQSTGTEDLPRALYSVRPMLKYAAPMRPKYAAPIKPQPIYGIPVKPGETQTEEKEPDKKNPMPISPPDPTE